MGDECEIFGKRITFEVWRGNDLSKCDVVCQKGAKDLLMSRRPFESKQTGVLMKSIYLDC